MYYVGRYVYNTTDKSYALITAKDSDDVLSINADLMEIGEGFEIHTSADYSTVRGMSFMAITTVVMRMTGSSARLPFVSSLEISLTTCRCMEYQPASIHHAASYRTTSSGTPIIRATLIFSWVAVITRWMEMRSRQLWAPQVPRVSM